ncbi:MAG TPA: hypothetical protein VGR35_01480 [Tepidisphaeraceae bacterium]|nr:hypothetical protein [Tepidisphaeraceae bacterium]
MGNALPTTSQRPPAAESYRLALQVGGPDAQICFDLAHAQPGEHAAAVE